jgi:regulation of enolase protein 1 (concanavalin A-like superfamily)
MAIVVQIMEHDWVTDEGSQPLQRFTYRALHLSSTQATTRVRCSHSRHSLRATAFSPLALHPVCFLGRHCCCPHAQPRSCTHVHSA